jgi:hypothetical protein
MRRADYITGNCLCNSISPLSNPGPQAAFKPFPSPVLTLAPRVKALSD